MVVDSTKTILGYECTMATCEYRGRKWTAWFAVDVPIQDGPWKLSGLPGLILEATESTGQHGFTATGIQTTQRQITPVLGKDHYEKKSYTSVVPDAFDLIMYIGTFLDGADLILPEVKAAIFLSQRTYRGYI